MSISDIIDWIVDRPFLILVIDDFIGILWHHHYFDNFQWFELD